MVICFIDECHLCSILTSISALSHFVSCCTFIFVGQSFFWLLTFIKKKNHMGLSLYDLLFVYEWLGIQWTITDFGRRKLVTGYSESEKSESQSVTSNSLGPHGLYNSPGQNTGVGSLSFLQGIFLWEEFWHHAFLYCITFPLML